MSHKCDLFKTKLKLPPLRPIPDVHMFDELPIRLQPRYNVKKEKNKKIKQLLEEKAMAIKRKMARTRIIDSDFEFMPFPQERYVSDLRKCVSEIVPTPMVRSSEVKILKFIPKPLRKKFPKVILDYIGECKIEWNNCLHKLIVDSTVKKHPGEKRARIIIAPFKFAGRTQNYENFLKSKRMLQERLMILYPLMKFIRETSVEILPEFILDFPKYLYGKELSLDGLQQLIDEDIEAAESMIMNNWYPKIVLWLKDSKRTMKLIQRKKIKLLTSSSNLIAKEITELMRRSIEDLIFRTSNEKFMPAICISLQCSSEVISKPTFNEIFSLFHETIKKIAGICQNIERLEVTHGLIIGDRHIKVKLSEWIDKESHQKIQVNLEQIYSPIQVYVKSLNDQYFMLFSSKTLENITEDIKFDDGCIEVHKCKAIKEKLLGMLDNEYFTLGQVHQVILVQQLISKSNEFEMFILNILCNFHINFNKSICSKFEKMAAKVSAIPNNPSELMESGAYCNRVKTVLVDELREKICESILIMSKLFDMTNFTKEHIALNTETVNWLTKIEPLIDGNAVTFENCKYEMEENLIQKTNVLMSKITDIVPHLEILDEMDDINNTLDYLEDIKRLVLWLNDCEDHVSMINNEEAVFKFPLSQYSELDELKNYILPFYHLMYLLHKWRICYSRWMDGPFDHINNKDVEVQHDEYCKKFTNISKNYKNKIKQQISDGVERRFKGLVEDPDPMNLPAPMKLCAQALNELKEFQPNVRLVNIMCNPALRQRHWDEMSLIAGQDLTPNAGSTIRKFIALNLWEDLEKYEIISIGACKELALKNELDEMVAEWKGIEFQTGIDEDTKTQIVVQFEDVLEIIHTHRMKVIYMQGSAFIKPFEEVVGKWYSKLMCMDRAINCWILVQNKWLYYLPFFSITEIIMQTSNEYDKFKEVNIVIKKCLEIATVSKTVISITEKFGFLDELRQAYQLLEEIHFGVQKYLNKKRAFFPRLFLLSDDEVFKILSEGNDFLKLQSFIRKIFNGIYSIVLENETIVSIASERNEIVKLIKPIAIADYTGCNEKWLSKLEEQMKLSIQSEIKLAFAEYSVHDIKTWSSKWQQMISICSFQLWFTENVEIILTENSIKLKSFLSAVQSQIKDLLEVVRDCNSTIIIKMKLVNLITAMSYAENVLLNLIHRKTSDLSDFHWTVQLKYYILDTNNIFIKTMDSVSQYGYEYLGNVENFIITPLTERCFRTLLRSYKMHFQGALEGLAGTGKTESIKNLANALAIQCVIFNCSNTLDVHIIERILRGVVSCGAWLCLDEINRINLEVLSVIGQQISSIVQAKREETDRFILNGEEMYLNPMSFICYTINPGYVGRSELPHNLKLSFRTITMNIPDTLKITEVSLFSSGYENYKILSTKIMTVHKLCSKLLPSNNLYEFGLRSVKSVLVACDLNRFNFVNLNENQLVLKSLKDIIHPKLISNDELIFFGILSDMFPEESNAPIIELLPIEKYQNIADTLNLQINKEISSKIIQLHEMISIYKGIILIGDPYSGKSSLLKLLAEVHKAEYQIIDPKIYEIHELFGKTHPTSREWEDGLISKYFRTCSFDKRDIKKWLIFDGPIESIWVENMNTVLDGSKRLCLSSGEIIFTDDKMTVMFEVTNLNNVSPATISRCGIVYLESSSIGIQGFVKSWINTCNKKWIVGYEAMLENLSTTLFPVALNYVKNNCFQYLPHSEMRLVFTCLNLMNMIMNDAVENEEDNKFFKTWIQATFILCIVWGIGGILDSQSREKFDEHIKSYLKDDRNFSETSEKIEVSIPTEGLLFDCMYQYKQKGSFKMWHDLVKSSKIIEKDDIKEIVIPTLDTVKSNYLLGLHIKYKKPLLLIGPTGIGKNFYVKDFMKTQSHKCLLTSISFTISTTVGETQEAILSKLNKKSSKFTSSGRVTSLVYIDDLNISAKSDSLELIRQCIDHNYFFDAKTKDQLFINDTLFIATMAPEDGIRKSVCPRFLKHFNMFSINYFSEDTIYRIFSNTLQVGMKRNGFGNDAAPSISAMVSGTWHIFQYLKENLKPIQKKCHYIFSLKDFFKVVQGCALIKKESADGKKILNRLWIHEIMRVFCDRLIDIEDRMQVLEKIKYCTKEYFKDNFVDVCESYKDQNGDVTLASLNNLMFGTYFDVEGEGSDKKYEEVFDMNKFHSRAIETLQRYNSQERIKLNMVFFDKALEHLSKMCRILSIPGENALLIGNNGSGKTSLTKIASLMLGQKVFQPQITDNYHVGEWERDLKNVLKISGGYGNETVFLLDELLLQNDLYIGYVANLLNCGEVPNLFKLNEKQDILEIVRLEAQGGNRNLDVSPEEVFSFFVDRYGKKLHTFLCISPLGKVFKKSLQNHYPIINACTIIWFDQWPEDALMKVANHFIENVTLSNEIKSLCIDASQKFHKEAINLSEIHKNNSNLIRAYVTSNSFINMMKSFATITIKKQDELREAKDKYISGLEKLELAAEAVSNMQQELNELKPQLIIMAVKGAEMMEEIEHETIEAAKATKQVREDEKIANEQAAAAQLLKKDCEADLALAIPILEDAIAALNTLKPTDITVVKSMKNPPAAIKLVMAAVCVMKSIPPDKIPDPANPGRKMYDFWSPSKRLLGDMSFLQNLKEYDKDSIPPTIMAKIRKEYLPHKDFKPQVIAKASTAAEGLCKWVIAMDMYDAVAKVVAPKKNKLQTAELEFANTMQILEEKKAMVARLEKKVADLHAALEEANLKKQRLEDEVEICINKLHRAEKLIGGLGGEKSRWTSIAENLQLLYDSLAGDILLSSAIITYLPTFPNTIREPIIKSWRDVIVEYKIPNYHRFSFAKVLATATKIQSWHMAGLPNDKMSVDNAVIQESSIKWSLLVDPQGQANKWIKKLEKSNNLNVTKLYKPNYLELLKKCVSEGLPILIENISDTLNLSLNTILRKQVYFKSDKDYILIDKVEIEYNKDFRLYMTTKLKNPKYSPDVFDKITLINFSLTNTGLAYQLLKIITAKERPDLEELREKVVNERAKYKASLKALETSILNTLQESRGDILEDEDAIEVLDSSKTLSGDILKKQIATKDSELSIEEFRQKYEQFANHSAILFYSVVDLVTINPMYEFSLTWFVNLFVKSIDSANKSKNLEKRLHFLKSTFTYNLYFNVCRSIFAEDRLLFSFILCCKILKIKGDISPEEFDYLLNKSESTQEKITYKISWLSENAINELQNLEKLPCFLNFIDKFVDNEEYWKTIYESPDLSFQKNPECPLSDFQQLLVLKIIKPEKFLHYVELFIKNNLSNDFTKPLKFSLRDFYRDSNCLIPLIILSSPGYNVMNVLQNFSKLMGYQNKFYHVSLGQNQGPYAEEVIKQCQLDGGWVCLQNCHLAESWMENLENICENIDTSKIDYGYRLWLVSETTTNFSQSILQSGIKMTKESPLTLKHNLYEYYTSDIIYDKSLFEGCPGKDIVYSKFLYCLRFFHALIRERKKFGSLGWNAIYNFDDTDFKFSVIQLQEFINKYAIVPFEMITYFIGECFYGGKITNEQDRKLLNTFLDELVNENVVNDPRFSLSLNRKEYNLPKRYECEDYINHINLLPSATSPEVLGLPESIQYMYDLEECDKFSNSFNKLYGESKESSDLDNNLILEVVTNILNQIPRKLSLEDGTKKYPIIYGQPLNAIFVQEIEQFNKLINLIKLSLENLIQSFKGSKHLTQDSENCITLLLQNKTPEIWTSGFGLKFKSLANFINHLRNQQIMLNNLIEGDHGQIKYVFWLPGFFNPRGFLTSLLQNHSRLNNLDITQLQFECKVNCKTDKNNLDFFISGLFIQCAKWNEELEMIDDSNSKSLCHQMPIIKLSFRKTEKSNQNNGYYCPLYKFRGCSSDENYITSLFLPSGKPDSYWIKRSTALLMHLPE